jgi:Zn ribbon nucleic-acid-binding protein
MMENPPLPGAQCPLCKSMDKHMLNVSDVYQPEGSRTQLVSKTYTLECAKCGHNYAICIEKEPGN